MHKNRWFGLLILGALVIMGQGCYLLEEEKKEEAYEFIPTKDRIKIPGTAYDKVTMYSDFEPDFAVDDLMAEINGDEMAFRKGLYATHELYPAHHADLNVALWHQVKGERVAEFRSNLTFVYQYQERTVGIIFVDLDQSTVSWADGKQVYLTKDAIERIDAISLELRHPENSR